MEAYRLMDPTSKFLKKLRCVVYDLTTKNVGQYMKFDFGG